jgi:hypothetical protein
MPIWNPVSEEQLCAASLFPKENYNVLSLGLGTEFRSEKIPRNILGIVSVIPRKKVLIPRDSEFRGRTNSEARNGTERNSAKKMKSYGTV